MLTKEQAAEELKKLMVVGWQEKPFAKAVSKRLGRPIRGELEESEEDEDPADWNQGVDLERACRAIAHETGDGVVRMIAGEYPKLSSEIQAAWRDFDRQPYLPLYSGKPFRAPGHAVVREARTEWIISLLQFLYGLDENAAWLAAWTPILSDHSNRWMSRHSAVPLLIGALDGEKRTSDAVFAVLTESAAGRHPIGFMGVHVIRSLLGCSRSDGWSFVEKMLLTAQREEGLRQSILESVDFAHPQAFRRMLRLIVDENLIRFSSTVRAVDAWFGFQYDSMSSKHAQHIIEDVLQMLDDEKARERALSGKDGEKAYLALWCIAFEDALASIQRAERVLKESRVADVRFAAAHLLGEVELPEAEPALFEAMRDADLRVAAAAFSGWREYRENVRPDTEKEGGLLQSRDAAARLGELLRRVKGKKALLKGAALPWTHKSIEAWRIVREMQNETPVENVASLIPLLDRMDTETREAFAWSLAGKVRVQVKDGYGTELRVLRDGIAAGNRATLLRLLGDGAKDVRAAAFGCFAPHKIEIDEAHLLESLLDRKASDLRTAAIERLLKQSDGDVLRSAERLIASTNSERRIAGLEIASKLIAEKRAADRAENVFTNWKASIKKPTKQEVEFAAGLVEAGRSKYRIEDCFGLLDDSKRIKPTPITTWEPPIELGEQGLRMLWSLHGFVEKHKAVEIPAQKDDGDFDTTREPALLGGDSVWNFNRPQEHRASDENLKHLPPRARELLEEWSTSQHTRWTGPEQEELLFAWVQWQCASRRVEWGDPSLPLVGGGKKKPKFAAGLEFLLDWAVFLYGGAAVHGTLLDWAERCAVFDTRSRVTAPSGVSAPAPKPRKFGFLRDPNAVGEKYDKNFVPRFASDWLVLARALPRQLEDPEFCRVMNLIRLAEDVQGDWRERQQRRLTRVKSEETLGYDSTLPDGTKVCKPLRDEFLRAWQLGACNEQDLFRWALMPEQQEIETDPRMRGFATFDFLGALYLDHPDVAKRRQRCGPSLEKAAMQVWSRALEIEFARGDGVTPVTGLVSCGGPPGDAKQVLRALVAIGAQRLIRNNSMNDGSKSVVFSGLIQDSRPSTSDTPNEFSQTMKDLNVPEPRLLELAVYAPQWAKCVEYSLNSPGLEDSVWWLRAHTKDSSDVIDDEVRDTWDACIAERSPVSKDDFQDGAVDVDWFRRVYNTLGKKRWEAMYDAAKFACGGAGHKRAQLFADALLGNVSEKELIARIDDKRHQDSVRALGLVDLGKGAAREKRVLERYRLMQEFRRTSRKHGGSMLQASEKRAVEIGMENLARSAGYVDPLRLQWAMETRETADLADGPVVVRAGDVQVSLRVNDEGAPEVEAVKKGKVLASVPPAAKKLPAVKELTERATLLRRQASRMRLALEQAMCRGEEFEASELKTLWSHPVLRPMLSRLVFVGDGLMGYPDKKGAVLRGHDGELEPLKASDRLRIAHPIDLLRAKSVGRGKKSGWELWQRECFSAERVQPFKQVFRELYLVTASEREKAETLRYQGQQVHPRQALALFGARGWVAKPEEGVQRTFYQEKVTAYTTFEEAFYTPADIEGLTVRGLVFAKRGKYEPLKLSEIPERVFSEVMRDLDLVVSVAHRGSVDPEASQSSLEMRASLLREVCAVLKLENVRVELPRAFIKGTFGEYSLHLGSANVQRLPGGALFILPVHSQHRGRVFLPFADDDPKCAEVISKVIMLARDSEIRDPGILEQLRG